MMQKSFKQKQKELDVQGILRVAICSAVFTHFVIRLFFLALVLGVCRSQPRNWTSFFF